MSSRVPLTPCPECGKPLDAATDAAGSSRPKPGDLSICLYCRNLMIFADDLTLRPPTVAEVDMIAGDPRVVHLVNLLGAYEKARAAKDQGDA